MKKLTRADIRGPQIYAAIRDDLRKRVIELKRARRVSVGPQVTLVFENRATMIMQVEEMCRQLLANPVIENYAIEIG